MCNQENERQDARGQTTVNLSMPQRVGGFARRLTRGRSMGVRFAHSSLGCRTSGFGRAETTTLADGMPLGIRPFSKSKLDELWGCGKLARGASDRCSVGTAASYSLQPNTYIGQPSQVVKYLSHDDWIFHS